MLNKRQFTKRQAIFQCYQKKHEGFPMHSSVPSLQTRVSIHRYVLMPILIIQMTKKMFSTIGQLCYTGRITSRSYQSFNQSTCFWDLSMATNPVKLRSPRLLVLGKAIGHSSSTQKRQNIIFLELVRTKGCQKWLHLSVAAMYMCIDPWH